MREIQSLKYNNNFNIVVVVLISMLIHDSGFTQRAVTYEI